MNATIAMDIIRIRMTQSGYEAEYEIRYRHFKIRPESDYYFDVPAGHILILVDPVPDNIQIVSEGGTFYFDPRASGELQHIHWGKVKITNPSPDDSISIFFVQAIP